jgi:hypothetical protein
MKRPNLFLFGLFFLVLAGCSKDESIRDLTDDSSVSSPYGTWKLVSRENYATNQVFFKEPGDVQPYCNTGSSCDIVLTLSRGTATDLISGHTITNTIGGNFNFDPSVRQINILSFGGTKLGEPHWSDNIWNNIYDVGRYKVNTKFLRLYLNSRQESLTFERQE